MKIELTASECEALALLIDSRCKNEHYAYLCAKARRDKATLAFIQNCIPYAVLTRYEREQMRASRRWLAALEK